MVLIRFGADECEHPELLSKWSPHVEIQDLVGPLFFAPGPLAHLAARLAPCADAVLAPRARVALAAAVEYLVCEILEFSGDARVELGATADESVEANEEAFAASFNLAILHVENIDPSMYDIYWHREWKTLSLIGCVHVRAAVEDDTELSAVFWWIDEFKARGGMPVAKRCARAKSCIVDGFASLALPVLVQLEIAVLCSTTPCRFTNNGQLPSVSLMLFMYVDVDVIAATICLASCSCSVVNSIIEMVVLKRA